MRNVTASVRKKHVSYINTLTSKPFFRLKISVNYQKNTIAAQTLNTSGKRFKIAMILSMSLIVIIVISALWAVSAPENLSFHAA